MQKKHLRGLLLILLLIGCGGDKKIHENPYLIGKKAIDITFPDESPARAVLFGPLELRTADATRYSELFTFQIFPYMGSPWLGGLQADGFDRSAVRIHRSLTSLMVEDSTAGLTAAAVPLPHGNGVAFYLEGETFSPVAFHLNRMSQDTLFPAGKKVGVCEVLRLADFAYCAITSDPEFTDEDGSATPQLSMHRALKDGQRRQVVLAFDRSAERARKLAETYRGMKREQLETAMLDSLRARLAFSLLTDDERTNRAFALLSVALAGAEPRLSLKRRAEIETTAALSPAFFLTARTRPAIVCDSVGAQAAKERLRWGVEAFRTVLKYGAAGEDSLKEASLRVLAEAAQVQADHVSDLFVLADETISDTLLRLAIAHLRYADMLTLCADISHARGDRDAENSYRTDASRAGREARRYFERAGRLFTDTTKLKHQTVEDTTEFAEDEEPELTTKAAPDARPPDTLRYVQSGAHHGFAWLAERPAEILPPELDGFTWQKWIAYRFANDLKITQTPDLDSVLTLLHSGPLPGVLTDDPGHDGEPSLPVMAAALENLAELYLGYHPDRLQNRVDLEPRPPLAWGHIVARVPYGNGSLSLDYDFENNRAQVGMIGLEHKLDVFFGYPLPTGGFSRKQFVLSPDEPRARIMLERDSENRVKIVVKSEN